MNTNRAQRMQKQVQEWHGNRIAAIEKVLGIEPATQGTEPYPEIDPKTLNVEVKKVAKVEPPKPAAPAAALQTAPAPGN